MRKRKFILMIALIGLTVSRAHAQQEVVTTKQEQISEEDNGNVSFDFRDADIQNVFRILSFKSGVNIVAGPEVTGVVTIKLDNVPWEQALNVILETYGYAYEKKGNIISVTTIETLKQRRENSMLLAEQEPLETKIFTLNFATAADVVGSISKMKSERGAVDFDSRINAVIVTDIHSRIEIIENVVATLDATTPQVLIEAKIVETNLNDSENLGIEWTVKGAVDGSARPTTYPFTTFSNNKYLPDNIPSTEEGFTYGTLDFSQFQAVLEMLKTRTDTNILSNPKIVTLDNKAARIEVGTQHPIPSFGANSETGELQTTGIVYQNIGINFQVTPHINKAGFVTLDLEPEVSEVSGSVSFQGIDVPLIGTEQVKTSVMVKDGETLVIAGLITDKVTDTKKKIPILGDIPLLGLVFHKTEKTNVKRDLIIFMTPHIITLDIDGS